MYNAQKGDKNTKNLVIANCWQYLYENFHKFSEVNKLKVTLALCTKDIPTQLEGQVGDTKIIIIRDGENVPVNSEAGRCIQLTN